MKKIICCVLLLFGLKVTAQPISSTSLLFDGVDDYINVSSPSLFYDIVGPTFPFTIEAWIRNDGTSPEQVIMSNRGLDNGILKGFKLSVFEGKLTFNGPSGAWQLGGVDLADSDCHHVAVVRNGNATWDVFIDGVVYPGMQGNPGDISSLFPLIIGAEFVQGLPESYFAGSMKEIRVWADARTQNDINSNMNIVLNTTSNPSLVDYWKLDEGTGNQAFNSSPNIASNFISTIFGNAAWTTSCSACMVLPQAVISASGPLTFCAGGNVTLSTPNVPGFSYQWKKFGNDIPGATLSSLPVNKSGKYKVVVTNASGCSRASSTMTVTVNPRPSASITANGPLSFCSGGSVVLTADNGSGYSYQWRKYGNPIAGATSINYTATKKGKYTCLVTNASGCTKASNGLTVSVPCRIAMNNDDDAHYGSVVFPNPSSAHFTITTSAAPSQIRLTDITGKVIQVHFTTESEGIYTLSGLNPGFYLVHLDGAFGKEVFRILKTE